MDPSDTLFVLSLALAFEALVGYPAPLFRAIGHPVTWMGAFIARLEGRLNKGANRDLRAAGAPRPPGQIAALAYAGLDQAGVRQLFAGERWQRARARAPGVFALLLLLGLSLVVALIATTALRTLLPPLLSLFAIAILASTLFAQRSLHQHVAAVRDALRRSGLKEGRKAVSMIVGRNPDVLDEAGVSRAAIESLAENFSDGVTAPAFWMAIFGLPGAVLYKAVNTADSMIGHLTPRHRHFGWAAARFDDLVNLPASRLTAVLIILAALGPGTSAVGAIRAVNRDSHHHRSPNAGWPEAAMAGALGLRLAGPRIYGNTLVDDRWMGDGRAEADANDIDRALALYRRALALLFGLILVLLVVTLR